MMTILGGLDGYYEYNRKHGVKEKEGIFCALLVSLYLVKECHSFLFQLSLK